ncbi:hypothetical protein D3P96_07215 [Weissella viridescens]|uniref:Uncharacterized protein n=1 Tax=Weissella viridescens TaxID=1629 RepID=A0A3P2RJE7_WEIVI|nr:polysaccharide biosynthesis C-terminal domain-containing protein [Weissella viridescens]RRG17558.1 hypothetical protein D3P96_07215 [Weissella viridescens]
MNKNKKLLNNTLIFAIGSIGTKLINILMVPIYTYLMTKSQYGSVDLFITTINMLAPIVGFSIADAVFRFTLDDEYDNKTVLSNGVALTLFGTASFALVSAIFYVITNRPNLLFISVMVMANVFVMLFLNYFRGTGSIRLFIVFSLVFAALNAILTAVGIMVGPSHVTGFIMGYILSAVITIFLMIICSKCYRDMRIDKIKKPIMRELLMYSVPLIPNAFAWWFTQDAAKFFILLFVGASGNGLYAVASKVPALVTIFYGIFSQAWQISAVDEFKSEDASEFYSETFAKLFSWLIVVVAVALLVLRPIMGVIVQASYYDAWQNIGFLLVSAVFSNLSAFVGTTYIAAKQTRDIMTTTFIGLIANLIFSVILIPIFGVQGAGLGSMLGFALVLWIRLVKTKKLVPIKVNLFKTLSSLIIVFAMIGANYIPEVPVRYGSLVVLLLLIALLNAGTMRLRKKG